MNYICCSLDDDGRIVDSLQFETEVEAITAASILDFIYEDPGFKSRYKYTVKKLGGDY